MEGIKTKGMKIGLKALYNKLTDRLLEDYYKKVYFELILVYCIKT